MKHILLAIDRGAPSWEAARLAIHLVPSLKTLVTGSRTLGWVAGDVSAGAAEAVIHRTHRPVVIAPSP